MCECYHCSAKYFHPVDLLVIQWVNNIHTKRNFAHIWWHSCRHSIFFPAYCSNESIWQLRHVIQSVNKNRFILFFTLSAANSSATRNWKVTKANMSHFVVFETSCCPSAPKYVAIYPSQVTSKIECQYDEKMVEESKSGIKIAKKEKNIYWKCVTLYIHSADYLHFRARINYVGFYTDFRWKHADRTITIIIAIFALTVLLFQ